MEDEKIKEQLITQCEKFGLTLDEIVKSNLIAGLEQFVDSLKEWCDKNEDNNIQKNNDRPAWKLLEVAVQKLELIKEGE